MNDDYHDRREYSYKYVSWIHFDKLKPLLMKMITPNVFERVRIDDTIREFDEYLQFIMGNSP
jgi:hypothetical protein